jgi:formate dehydrogenase major subunit
VPVEGGEFSLEVDTVIAALGQRLQEGACACVMTDRGRICADPRTLATSEADVFAAGDATEGDMTVVDAIADGHRAARSIHSYLSGEEVVVTRKRAKTSVSREVMEQLEQMADEEVPMAAVPMIPDAYRCTGFSEIELGYSFPTACREAARCLHCDYVTIEEEA